MVFIFLLLFNLATATDLFALYGGRVPRPIRDSKSVRKRSKTVSTVDISSGFSNIYAFNIF